MSEQTSQPDSNDVETHASNEGIFNSENDITQDALVENFEYSTIPAQVEQYNLDEDERITSANRDEVIYPLPEDYIVTITEKDYGYHEVDAGMVEVSLALAGLVFTVAAISADSLSDRPTVLGLLLILVVLTSITALRFLIIYCMQKDVIYEDAKKEWDKFFSIFLLYKLHKNAPVYFWLTISLLFLVVMFCIIIWPDLLQLLL